MTTPAVFGPQQGPVTAAQAVPVKPDTLPYLYGPERDRGPAPLIVGVGTGVPWGTVEHVVARLLSRYPSTPVAVLTANVPRECQVHDPFVTEQTGPNPPLYRLLVVGLQSPPLTERTYASLAPGGAIDCRYPALGSVAECSNVFIHTANDRPAAAATRDRVLVQFDAGAMNLESPLFAEIDKFNRNALSAGEMAHWRNQQGVLPDRVLRGLPELTRDGLTPLLIWYALADTLALNDQRAQYRLTVTEIVICGLTTFLTVFFLGLPDVPWWIRACSPGSFVAGLVAGLSTWLGYRRRHVAARVLAEAVRVQVFWRLGGLPDSAAEALLDCLLNRASWAVLVLRSWELLSRQSSHSPPNVDLVRRRWCHEQRAYILRAREILLARAARPRVGKMLMAIAGLIGVLPAASFLAHKTDWFSPPEVGIAQVLGLEPWGAGVVGMSILSLVAGLAAVGLCCWKFIDPVRLSHELRQLDELDERYAQAEVRLDNGESPLAVFRGLGIDALRENVGWAQGPSSAQQTGT